VNTAIFAPTGVFNGIGFAIPINQAAELVGGVVDFNNTMPDVPAGQLAAWARCGRQIGNTFRLPGGQTIVAPHPFKGNCVDCHPQLLSQTAPGINNVGARPGNVRVAAPGQKTAALEPTLGLALLNVDEINARQLNIVVPEGALVNNVIPGGPGEAAGLKRGDVLIRIDGRKIRDIETIADFIAGQKIGKKYEIVYLRDGSRLTTKIRTGVKPVAAAVAAPPPVKPQGEFEWKGGDFQPLSPALSPYVKNGVYVADIEGVMALSGLKVGDIIVGVDGKQVTDLNSFIAIAKKLDMKKGFMLDVVRAGNPLYITVKG
ncbi:MAG: PDZ domain-containing protein, partial [Desulfuromonadales bacterium]